MESSRLSGPLPRLALGVLALLLSSAGVAGCGAPRTTDVPPERPTAAPTVTATSTVPPSPRPTESAAPLYAGPYDYSDIIYSDEQPRAFHVHIPPTYRPGTPTPLVLVFHGAGQEIWYIEAMSEMSDKADQAGFIVVYPRAQLQYWNVEAGRIGAIDVQFVRALIEHLEREYSIDPARIYASGFSNGGGMAHRLACDLSDRIAAIAPVAGAYMNEQPCEPGRPVPILAFHGTADVYAPYDRYKVPEWAAAWAARNGCDLTAVISFQEDDVTAETWETCDDHATVTLYTIAGGRHVWPGSQIARQFFPEVQDVPANDLIWEFFLAHPLSR